MTRYTGPIEVIFERQEGEGDEARLLAAFEMLLENPSPPRADRDIPEAGQGHI